MNEEIIEAAKTYIHDLFKEAERLAKEEGKSALYVSTDHIGLYEKYGFAFREEAQSIYGESSRVYEKKIEVR